MSGELDEITLETSGEDLKNLSPQIINQSLEIVSPFVGFTNFAITGDHFGLEILEKYTRNEWRRC